MNLSGKDTYPQINFVLNSLPVDTMSIKIVLVDLSLILLKRVYRTR